MGNSDHRPGTWRSIHVAWASADRAWVGHSHHWACHRRADRAISPVAVVPVGHHAPVFGDGSILRPVVGYVHGIVWDSFRYLRYLVKTTKIMPCFKYGHECDMVQWSLCPQIPRYASADAGDRMQLHRTAQASTPCVCL